MLIKIFITTKEFNTISIFASVMTWFQNWLQACSHYLAPEEEMYLQNQQCSKAVKYLRASGHPDEKVCYLQLLPKNLPQKITKKSIPKSLPSSAVAKTLPSRLSTSPLKTNLTQELSYFLEFWMLIVVGGILEMGTSDSVVTGICWRLKWRLHPLHLW